MQVQIGDKIIECEMKNGIPNVQGVWSEQIPNKNGGMDCVVHVPCQILKGKNELEKENKDGVL